MMDKRKPMLARKPAVVVAIGQAEKAKPEGLMCPKCGHQLADTPENREYAKAREAESEPDEEYEDED